jgi:outer membrane murein-binding lipoprotein Lpp
MIAWPGVGFARNGARWGGGGRDRRLRLRDLAAGPREQPAEVIQAKIERTFNRVNIETGDLANRVEKVESKVEKTFNQVNATTNALSAGHDDLAAQVAQLQADMELVKDALNIP